MISTSNEVRMNLNLYNDVKVVNTFFQHSNVHKYTWSTTGSCSVPSLRTDTIQCIPENLPNWLNQEVISFLNFKFLAQAVPEVSFET
jgi:hypothetical protein